IFKMVRKSLAVNRGSSRISVSPIAAIMSMMITRKTNKATSRKEDSYSDPGQFYSPRLQFSSVKLRHSTVSRRYSAVGIVRVVRGDCEHDDHKEREQGDEQEREIDLFHADAEHLLEYLVLPGRLYETDGVYVTS